MASLKQHLDATGETQSAFAQRSHQSNSTISRAVNRTAIPRKGQVEEICRATGGAVMPTDFYDLPDLQAKGAAMQDYWRELLARNNVDTSRRHVVMVHYHGGDAGSADMTVIEKVVYLDEPGAVDALAPIFAAMKGAKA